MHHGECCADHEADRSCDRDDEQNRCDGARRSPRAGLQEETNDARRQDTRGDPVERGHAKICPDECGRGDEAKPLTSGS